ncbi:hypothetical protein KFV05_05070 [Macrococcoides canis]|uniref:hypothetical protein n=1 Tax=Macrococcoides canis TaxID=1855823 RepID=UPI0020B67531|nr:hypothetical protein [Macrococcus canis]UTH03360.1 hypothetical protein KFV05_05070 [Macrococcus canis]
MNNVFFKSKLLISLAIIGTLFGILGVILAIYKSEYAMIPTLICALIPILFVHYYDSEEKKYYENHK